MRRRTRRILVELAWTSLILALAACVTTGFWLNFYLTSVQHIDVSNAISALNDSSGAYTVDMTNKSYFCFQNALPFLREGRSLVVNGHGPEPAPGTKALQNIIIPNPIPPYHRLKNVAPSPSLIQIHLPMKASDLVANRAMPTSFITIHTTTTKTISIYVPRPKAATPIVETSGFDDLPLPSAKAELKR